MTIDTTELRELALIETRYKGYFVDASGNVWSSSNWRGYGLRKLAPFPNSHGYPSVKVKHEGVTKKALIHVLVCEAFHGEKPTEAHQVRHIDGVSGNCQARNLAWGTAKENAADRKIHGTERAAINGMRSAYKLIGKRSNKCLRGHDKEGRSSCEECRRERRRKIKDGLK